MIITKREEAIEEEDNNILVGLLNMQSYFNRSSRTIRDWFVRGCPHWKDDKNVWHCDIRQVESWIKHKKINLDSQEEDYDEDDEGNGYSTAKMNKAKLEKLQAEARKLQDDERVREGELAPVEEFEQAHYRSLMQVKDLVVSAIDDIKSSVPELSAARSEGIDKRVSELFRDIANLK